MFSTLPHIKAILNLHCYFVDLTAILHIYGLWDAFGRCNKTKLGIIAILQRITMYIDMKISQISQAMSHYVLMNYSKQFGDKIIQTSSDWLCDNIVGRQWQPTCLHFANNFAQNTKCDLTFTCFEGRGWVFWLCFLDIWELRFRITAVGASVKVLKDFALFWLGEWTNKHGEIPRTTDWWVSPSVPTNQQHTHSLEWGRCIGKRRGKSLFNWTWIQWNFALYSMIK